MKDLRRSPRFSIDRMVQLSFGNERVLETKGLNVSHHGLLCETPIRVPPNTRLFILLSLPMEDQQIQVPAEGVVVRVEETASGSFQLGIELKESSGDHMMKWVT